MSTILKPIATKLATIAEALDYTPAVTAHVWAPRMLAGIPALVIEPPAGTRTQPDEAESQLYTNDWDLDFTCTFYADLNEAAQAQERLVDLVELWVSAIDANEQLDGLCNSAKVTEWQRPAELEIDGSARSLLFTQTTVAVQLFV